MTEILAELQAGYDQRAQMALEAPVSPPALHVSAKATRTYSGAALERRRAWGKMWGALNAEHARKLRAGELED